MANLCLRKDWFKRLPSRHHPDARTGNPKLKRMEGNHNGAEQTMTVSLQYSSVCYVAYIHALYLSTSETRWMHSWWCTSIGELQVLSRATWWKAAIHFGYGYFRFMFLISIPLLLWQLWHVLTRNYIICRSISAPSTVEWTTEKNPNQSGVIGTSLGGIFYTTAVYLHVLWCHMSVCECVCVYF